MSTAPSTATPTGLRAAARQLARGAVFVLLLCLLIALLLSVGGSRFGVSFVYSLCIGGLCWLIIDGGRQWISLYRNRRRTALGLAVIPGFPGWPWMAALMVAGFAVGPIAGNRIAAALLGEAAKPELAAQGSTSALTWLITLIASAASVLTLSLVERLSHARAEAEAARRAAAENRLKLLESQLEPHMLFNTLSNLRVLIGIDPPRAQAMLDRLIAFLRATLDGSRAERCTLAAEFERVADYLALMQVRLGARLSVRLDLPDALRTLPVPPMLLQPLVENALEHGIEPKVEGGHLEVAARREGHRLRLRVQDSGVGLSAQPRAGFGLQQVRERLAALHGDAAGFALHAGGGGTVAEITLPIST